MLWILGLIVVISLAYALIWLYTLFEQLLFVPKRQHILKPSTPYKKLMIENRLAAWRFDGFPNRKTVMFCHGNYGNISYTDFVIKICHKQKLNLLVFDYSGYGDSLGTPNQKIACQDGETAYHYLCETLDPDEIIIWGMSMGGAVATYVASRNPCHSLILMSTFSSLDDIIKDYGYGRLCSFLVHCIGLIIDNMPSKERIKLVKCPVVIMHSREDELIPYTNGLRLYDSIGHSCKKFIEISGGHIAPIIDEKGFADLFTFCCLDATQCHMSRKVLKSLRHLRHRYEQLEKNVEETRTPTSYSLDEDDLISHVKVDKKER